MTVRPMWGCVGLIGWLVGASGEGGRGVKMLGCAVDISVDFNKLQIREEQPVKRGRFGTRRFRVRGQRTPEVVGGH